MTGPVRPSPLPPPPGGNDLTRPVPSPKSAATPQPGAPLDGRVVGQTSTGRTVVSTASGLLQVLTKTTPPVGSRVIIEPGAPGTQATLRSLPTTDRAGGNSTPSPAAQPKPTGEAQYQLPTLRPGATVSAARLPLSARTTPEFSPTPSPSSPGAGPANPQAGNSGSPLLVRILSVTPQLSAEISPAQQTQPYGTASSSVFTRGTLVSNNPGQASIVRTPTGLLELGASTTLRPGASLTVQVLEPMILSNGTTVRSAGSPHDIGQANWPSLDPLMAALKSMTGEGKHSQTGLVPTDHAGGSVVLLRFLSALKSGEVRTWLGDDRAERLIAHSPEAFLDVFEEFQMFGRLAQQDSPGDWRQFWLPLLTADQLAQIRLFERKHSAPQQDEQAKQTKRQFVFDVTLSQLGRIQLDGAFEQESKHLNVTVRSEAPIAEAISTGIRNILFSTSDVLGITGAIEFDSSAELVEYIEDDDTRFGADVTV